MANGPYVYTNNPSPGYAQPGGDPNNPSSANWGQSTGGGFDPFGLVTGIIDTVTKCETNCWVNHIGNSSKRTQCLLACKQAGAPVYINQGGGGLLGGLKMTDLALGAGLFLLVKNMGEKKKKRR
jgi:hypothetical protein